jgi:hypothetical protein
LGGLDNRLLRRISGPRKDEAAGGWRKLRNEEIHNLHRSPDVAEIIKYGTIWAGHVARIGR